MARITKWHTSRGGRRTKPVDSEFVASSVGFEPGVPSQRRVALMFRREVLKPGGQFDRYEWMEVSLTMPEAERLIAMIGKAAVKEPGE